MAGLNGVTLRPVSGWPHVAQSLNVILTTEIGERVMRRRFGLDGGALQDRPMNAFEIADAFAAIADAIEPRLINGRQYGEPRFQLERVAVTRAGADGVVGFSLEGYHFPRGHFGDFSIVEPKTLELNPAA